MKDATLAQGNQVFNLILQKNVPAAQLQELLGSGLLSDLLDANVQEIDRGKFLWLIGLKSRALRVARSFVTTTYGRCGYCGHTVYLIKNPWGVASDCEKDRFFVRSHLREGAECGGNLKPPKQILGDDDATPN